MNKMQDTNIIGDTAKDRRIDYDLIDRLNKQYETKARKQELEGKLAGKKKKKEEKEEPAAKPIPTSGSKYIQTLDELREIKGNYSLQKGIYTIDFEIIVPHGNTLILQPGVELYFTKDACITCEGKFEARGKDGLEVLLTAKDQEDGWQNLYLKGMAEGVLDYTRFSYGRGRKDVYSKIMGGAVFMKTEVSLNPNLTINNSCFKKNSAYYGGGLYILQGNIAIGENNRFENNSAEWGGGIYNNDGNVAIGEKNIFENNFAKENGGATRNYQGTLKIDESKNIFIGNMPDNIFWK